MTPGVSGLHHTCRARYDLRISLRAKGKLASRSPNRQLTPGEKGIVMRPDALRPATAKAAAKATGKLATRLSKGEKRNRKRLAELGVVYDATPACQPSPWTWMTWGDSVVERADG